MKFECSQSDLLKVVSQVATVSERKTTMPILGNVLLEVKDKQLMVGGTDLEISILATCSVDTEQNGRICTPAAQFLEIVKRLPKTTAVISKDEQGWLHLHSGKAHFRISAVDAGEFPKLPKLEEVSFTPIHSELFRKGFDKISFAISVDEMRYNLNGVYVERLGNDIQLVATDGHRLATYQKTLEEGHTFNLEKSVTLPRKGVTEVRRLLSDYQDKFLDVSITKSGAAFKMGSTTVFMKLVVGDFPDFRAILPQTVQKVLVVNKDILLDSIRRVSLLSDGKSKSIKLTVKPDTLLLQANSSELGEAQEEISCEFTSDQLVIGFNAKYLVDALSVIEGENVHIQLDGEQSPGVLRSPTDPDALSLIMPMRI